MKNFNERLQQKEAELRSCQEKCEKLENENESSQNDLKNLNKVFKYFKKYM